VDGLYERILVGEEKIAPKKKSLQVIGRGERCETQQNESANLGFLSGCG
jgi:hypothetical protein